MSWTSSTTTASRERSSKMLLLLLALLLMEAVHLQLMPPLLLVILCGMLETDLLHGPQASRLIPSAYSISLQACKFGGFRICHKSYTNLLGCYLSSAIVMPITPLMVVSSLIHHHLTAARLSDFSCEDKLYALSLFSSSLCLLNQFLQCKFTYLEACCLCMVQGHVISGEVPVCAGWLILYRTILIKS